MSTPFRNEYSPFNFVPEEQSGESRVLHADELVCVDLDRPLASRQDTIDSLRIAGELVASVQAGGKPFFIIDTRDSTVNRPFIVMDQPLDPASRKGYKGVEDGGVETFGRGYHRDRFTYPLTVSEHHFQVGYQNDALFVQNLHPTNPTVITTNLIQERPDYSLSPLAVKDNRTWLVVQRMLDNPDYSESDESAPYGYFAGLPIIGRKSKTVSGGVYLGGSREGIVVDDTTETMGRVYAELHSELREEFRDGRTYQTEKVLKMVMAKVRQVMPYDGPKAEEISRRYYGDQLVGLSTYVHEKAGVCRHQGLLAASLMERLIEDNMLVGNVGVERNTVPDFGGTHGWAIYRTMHRGKLVEIVVDPAQNFVGSKNQARREKRWEYYVSMDDYTSRR